MKKMWQAAVCAVLAAVLVLGISACKKQEEPPEETLKIVYAGEYRAETVELTVMGSQYKLELGKDTLLGKLTKDLAVCTLKEDGTLSFQCSLFGIVTFDVTGTWTPSEEDEKKISAVISEQTIPADCDGETLQIVYEGATFSLRKG